MEGSPVTIRFLDPPLHEFVPTEEEDIESWRKAWARPLRAQGHHRFPARVQPHDGSPRLPSGRHYPEIAEMQTVPSSRLLSTSEEAPDENVKPEIMIPLVGEVKELKFVKNIVVATADAEIAAAGVDMKYQVGTMIEIPRAALTADEIAKEAEFFCFGTNDLTR